MRGPWRAARGFCRLCLPGAGKNTHGQAGGWAPGALGGWDLGHSNSLVPVAQVSRPLRAPPRVVLPAPCQPGQLVLRPPPSALEESGASLGQEHPLPVPRGYRQMACPQQAHGGLHCVFLQGWGFCVYLFIGRYTCGCLSMCLCLWFYCMPTCVCISVPVPGVIYTSVSTCLHLHLCMILCRCLYA